VRSQVLTVLTVEIIGFWEVLLCNLEDMYQHCRGAFCILDAEGSSAMLQKRKKEKKKVSVNLSHALFSFVYHDDLAMEALVCLCKVWFRAIWFSTASVNLRQPHIFKLQI